REIMRLRPEIMRRRLGLGRDGVEVAHRDALAAVAVARAGAGACRADIEAHESGRREIDDLPAIDRLVGAEAARPLEEGRSGVVLHPARHAHGSLAALGLDRRAGDCRGAQGRRMDELQMRQVEEILDDEEIIPLEVQALALGAPGRIVHPMEIRDERRIGERRIAHPDPNPMIAFDDRIGAHPRLRRDRLLARHADAGAAAVIDEAVIEALDIAAFELAVRERHVAMAAAILQRGRAAILLAPEHDRLAANLAAHQLLPPNLPIPRRDIPEIAGKHDRSPPSVSPILGRARGKAKAFAPPQRARRGSAASIKSRNDASTFSGAIAPKFIIAATLSTPIAASARSFSATLS